MDRVVGVAGTGHSQGNGYRMYQTANQVGREARHMNWIALEREIVGTRSTN